METTIPASAHEQQLTSTLFVVYQEIELLLTKFKGGERDEDGRRWIWKSNRELFQTLKDKYPYLKISLSTVQRSLRRLAELGYLLRSQRKRQRLWHVQFYALPDWHPQAQASAEIPDARESSKSKQRVTDESVVTHKHSSTGSRSTNIRKAVGFGQYKRDKALTGINAEVTRPVDKPAERVLINGIWCVQDNLFPLSPI